MLFSDEDVGLQKLLMADEFFPTAGSQFAHLLQSWT